MRRTPAVSRVTGALAIALALTLGAAAPADANSIVYRRSQNVWISTPNGAQGYQLTFDGGWDSPSEADNGTIMAVKNGQTYRFSPSGQPLGVPVPTIFHGADPTTNVGPAGVRISPDGTERSYWGTSYTSYEDFSCGCVMFRWEAYSRWGASDQFNEPNQTRGQQLYGEPAWIDNQTLLLTDVGSLFGDEVATYTVGGGDNTLTQWFSDPDTSVTQLQFGTITRQRDKVAFVASTQTSQNEIRFYQSTGPAPSPPTPMCAITGTSAGQFSYTSFAPDGTQIAWQEPDGIHVGAVGSLDDCTSITDRLVIPGGTQPFFGSATVNMANAPSAPSSGGTGNPAGPSGPGQPGGGGTPQAGGPTGSGQPGCHSRSPRRPRYAPSPSPTPPPSSSPPPWSTRPRTVHSGRESVPGSERSIEMTDATDRTRPEAWLPEGFRHPTRVELGDVHLRPIRGDDAAIDYPAVMASRGRLWVKYGEAWGWPPATMTEEQDREDLEHHEREILAHESFNYAILNAEESRLLGCVYLDPPRPGDDGDVIVSWWVVDELLGGPVERALEEFVPRWVTEAWPFRRPISGP